MKYEEIRILYYKWNQKKKIKTLSDNIDIAEGVTIKNSYTKEEKQKILIWNTN